MKESGLRTGPFFVFFLIGADENECVGAPDGAIFCFFFYLETRLSVAAGQNARARVPSGASPRLLRRR